MSRHIINVDLYERRSGQGSEGWPRCLMFEFDSGFPLSVELADQHEYSQLAETVRLLNQQLRA